jgi:hypothetical protein
MVRTQVQLTEDQARLVKAAAAARGVSMAEVLRQLVDEHLTKGPGGDRRQRAMQAVGRHRSGRRNVSRDHDRELADAFAR